MRQYTHDSLIFHPQRYADPDLIVEVTRSRAGWETIHFQVRQLADKDEWSGSTGEKELAVVLLSGSVDVASDRGEWQKVGVRTGVFSGLPEALYLPRRTEFKVTAQGDCTFAAAWAFSSQDHDPKRVYASQVKTEIRGGGQATRQINSIIPPGFPCDRLVVVEVYTPGGNWSSYPPHKHDVHTVAPDGSLVEADLDEIYYYQIDRPEGYALQRVYTGSGSPLQQAGKPFDCALVAHTHDVVIVPEGYHPVTSPVGYTTYYLNVLAGSAQSLAASDDPDFAWVKNALGVKDPRLPIYPVNSL
ncbi:MAG: 5-deoxy-glucuronate isomerase [Anaerolineaceae bacterium]|jgi:5-deoxy-glucuronate isomerase